MLEKELELKIKNLVESLGGKCFKWVSPGCAGVPDRICILPPGHVIFVELKRPGVQDGRSPRQKKVFSVLSRLSCTVWLINDFADFKDKLSDYIFKECADDI